MLVVAVAVVLIISMFQPTTVLHIGNGVFDARIASTQVTREKGLGGVTNLSSRQAMIFAFPSDAEWQMWMKDMKVPIDIVWLDKDKTVIHSVINVSPDNSAIFSSTSPARYVVELPAGTVDDQHIQAGHTATFDINQGDVN